MCLIHPDNWGFGVAQVKTFFFFSSLSCVTIIEMGINIYFL